MSFKNLLSAEENLKTYLDGKNNHRDDVSSELLKIFELEKKIIDNFRSITIFYFCY